MNESLFSSTFIYLHGFASSPQSSKGRWLRKRLATYGPALRIPDLNVPDFAHLTVSAMIEHVRQEIATCPAGPVHLIGSSLGGFVATHFLAQHPDAAQAVADLVLLAPALDFAANRRARMGGPMIERWQQTGWHEFYNYRDQAPRPVHYALMNDAATYNSYAVQLALPMLVVHGLHDESVSYEQSVRFAAQRPNVVLKLVNSDHGLLDYTESLWHDLMQFWASSTPHAWPSAG